MAAQNEKGLPLPVTVENFVRAESDRYFERYATSPGHVLGRFMFRRDVSPVDDQTIVSQNRDTLYAAGVFDLRAGPVTITLPDPGGRFMSMQTWNEDQNTPGVTYTGGRYDFSESTNGSRYMLVALRILVNANEPGDVQAGRDLQDAVKVQQPGGPGTFEIPDWDPVTHKRVRDALLVLAATIPDSARMFGMPGEVDPIRFLCGASSLWGGNRREDAIYLNVTPDENDGKTPYTLTVRDVPVDGFWSVIVYDRDKYIPQNDRKVYSFNNLTAIPNADGSVTIRFANDDAPGNCIPIVPGWNYTVRLYKPRREILDGSWVFPEAIPLSSAPARENSPAPAPTEARMPASTVHRRAIEAAIWGMPIVSVDAMREAYFRDAGATYNDIIYFADPADWRFQFTTPNASTHYVYFNFNLGDGPVVLEVPPTVGAGLFGSLVNAWQVPVTDVGTAGADKGKGARYLLIPPNHVGTSPSGYFPIEVQTINGYALLRAIPAGPSAEDKARAVDLIKRIRIYPLAQQANPPKQRYLDVSGKLVDGVVAFDETFYDRLARMIDEEPVQTRDLVAMGQIRSLGIEKGKPFKPDAVTKAILRQAANEAHDTFKTAAVGGDPWWPGTQWKLPESVGPKTAFSFQTEDALYLDNRGLIFFIAFAAPKQLGGATFYVVDGHDSQGRLLSGEQTYRLHVPPGVPAKQYWAVTVYDLDTACLIRDLPRPGLDSYNEAMHRNADGAVDVYFGPEAPSGREANWIPTAPGKPWFSMFRFYGPDKAVFDKSWRLTDIEPVAP